MDYETFIHVNFLLFYCLSVIGQTINESDTKYISILPDGSYGYFQAKKYNIGKNGAYPPTQNGDTRSLVRPFSRNGSAKILTFSSQ